LRNLGEVANLIAAVRRRSGRVSAVIHGAAINRPRRAHRVTAEDAREEIGPKLVGALNLFDALRDDPPAIFCAFTSVIGVTGMPNNTWYAFANQALDRSLGMFASCHPETDAVSMAFSLWGEIGMGVNLGSVESLGSLGTDAIPTEEGVQRFLDLFTQESLDRQVIITGRLGGIDTWRPEFPLFPKGARFLEDVRFFQPGVELIARSHLHLDRDSYLLDHRYKGSYLFPTVFGLEAMAQSVAYVLKRCELPKLSIRDVKLHRPLLVDPARGLTIEVVARVAEDDSEVTAVDVAVRSEQTGFASDHFTARFVLGSRSDLASESELPASAASTNIDPARDLYGPILFQGPRFQRIVRVRTLDSGHCSFDANETPEGAFVLGDPYVRDALLQSLQLCTLPDRCLPVQIRRIDICDPNRAESGIRSCIAQIDDRTDEAYVGSVACSSLDGQPLEILVDYHAKIIERQPLWPTPQELAERGTTTDHGASAAFVEGGDWDGGAHYRDVVAYGPQKQTAFFLRFPLTAQECQGPHGAVSFTNYYRWAGKTRELGTINTPGAYSKLIDMLASQELTAATNSFETRILGLPRPNDMIEVRYWAENVTRQDADAIYEWWRIPFPPGSESCEMIAWSRMKTSAVKVLNHGHVMSSEWPEFFFQFLSSMGPRTKDPTPEPVLLHDMGEQLFSGEGRALRQPAQEYVVQTTLEDGNVVGNVYFANYGIWQGRARDRLLYRVSPSLFNPTTTRSMVHCVETNTYHLREAMPFDEISVRTYISAVYERGLRLEFDFTRMAEGVPSCKLARGFHEAIWVPVGYGIAPRPTSWPVEVRETLLALAEEQLASQAAS
jgi:acyl-CoA thioesterase FadM